MYCVRDVLLSKSICSYSGDHDPLIALAVLVYLLPDSRSKPDHTKVLYFIEVCELFKWFNQNVNIKPNVHVYI